MQNSHTPRGDAERWTFVAAGGALAAFGIARGGFLGRVATIAGGVLAVQAWRGRVGSPIARNGLAEATTTIAAPPERVFAFWQDRQQLAAVVPQIDSIEELDDGLTEWRVRLPGGVPLRWRARIESADDRRLVWRTDGPCTIEHEGELRCTEAPGDRGTEVRVRMRWRDPTGGLVERLADFVGGLAGHAPDDELRRGLEAVKQQIEAGELATAAMRAEAQARVEPDTTTAAAAKARA